MAVTTTPKARAPRRRMPLWDNGRWVAITLVVIGHSVYPLTQHSNAAYGTYLFIYLFHVPVLVTVSGYFARSGPLGVRKMKQLLTDIIFPYLIFQTIWTLVHWGVTGTLVVDYTSASWTLWFLIALGFWRVLLPYLVLLRYPMTISVVASVAVGYLGEVGHTLSLSRTIALLPFFVLGWKLRQWHLTTPWLALPRRVAWRFRAIAIVLFLALAAVIWLEIGTWRSLTIRRFFLYDEDYADSGYPYWWSGGIRLAVLALGMLFTCCVLILLPRGTTWVSSFGRATLYIYLLHSFVLYPIRQAGLLDEYQPVWVLILVIAAAIALSVLLSQPWIRRLFQPLVQPRARWLFRKKETTETGTLVLPPE